MRDMKTGRKDYRISLQKMSDDELDNEHYTLRNERQYLDSLSDDEVADRVNDVELEKATRR
jgi:uncharacterized protein YjiS (DUF1127 family)